MNTPVVCPFTGERAFHFSSQEKFFGENENKIHFFLVGFETDF
jgi:ATP-dependent RNA circularization protein (DNA/RNA ligase family)